MKKEKSCARGFKTRNPFRMGLLAAHFTLLTPLEHLLLAFFLFGYPSPLQKRSES